MFAPQPPAAYAWHVVKGVLENGKEVELVKDSALFTWKPNDPFTWDKPQSDLMTRKNGKWSGYFTRMTLQR
jgi:hypothetical protein